MLHLFIPECALTLGNFQYTDGQYQSSTCQTRKTKVVERFTNTQHAR